MSSEIKENNINENTGNSDKDKESSHSKSNSNSESGKNSKSGSRKNSKSGSEKDSKSGSDKDSKSESGKDSKGVSEENSENSSSEEVHDSFGNVSEDSFEDEDFNKLKDELDKANNFIDYFLVIGVEPEIYKKEWLYENDIDELNNKYKEHLEPKIISSFPPFEKHTISFDDSILTHCFPNGYKIIKSETQPKPIVFSFILDNNYFNLNYPQKYLTCLICFENIGQYKLLKEQEKQFTEEEKEEDKKENDDTDNKFNINEKDAVKKIIDTLKYPNIYIPKCLLLMSLSPYFGEYEKIITEIYNYSQGIFHINKNEKGKRKALNIKKDIKKDLYEPIDKIIENLLIELPVPPRGFSTVEYTLNNEKRLIKQTKMNELPIININLKRVFIDFEAKDIITIYNYLFLEGRILFFSQDIEILNTYIFGFLSLLYPFQYQYQIVTILPEKNFEIIESITPFIAGINQSYETDFFDKRGYTLSDSILVIDIDNCKYVICNEMSELPEFPKNLKTKLEKGINSIINKYIKKDKLKKIKQTQISSFDIKNISLMEQYHTVEPRSETVNIKNKQLIDKLFSYDNNELLSNFQIDYEFNKEISELFFNFNANLLSNYSKFLNLDFYSSNIMPCLEILFKVEDFLKEIPEIEKSFYDKFISETQIFGDFLYLRMIPKNTKEKIRVLLFDEKIYQNNAKMFSKAPPSIFTKSKEYEFIDKFEIQKPRKITENEFKYYKKYKINLLSYGIVVNENKKEDKIKFIYPIFPKLTTKFFFQQNYHEYYCPNNWNESIEGINEELISKSHLGGISIRENDMKNYIYICWMQMWSMTFWYCDEIEQNYRFQKLIEVLNKTTCYEMEIFNLLFEALHKYGKNDNMILKLYAILLQLHLNPSLKVHKIVMEIIEKKNLEGNFNEKLKSILEKEKHILYNKKDFRKRVFRPKYCNNILSEDITFFAFDSCIICQKSINLEEVCKNYKGMTRELEWVKCPKCKNPMLPKILIQFGKEINKDGQMKFNTSKYENVVLFSPYSLKNNYTTTLLKNFGVKLDLEELIMKYGGIFWDSLWYFKLNKLEYDFMLPYEKKIEVEYVNTFGINKGKKNINNNENGFNIDDLEIEKYQITIYKSK